MEIKPSDKKISKFLMSQILVIGLIYSAAQMFGYLEAEIFNTYLDHVLHLEYLYITIMVVLSAIMGLVSNLFLGIMSDNLRSDFGRRRPFLLLGGILAGISMIIYPFSQNFLMAIIIDVIAVGIASNSYYVAQRTLIPDVVEIEYRGRANGIVNILGNMGLIISIALFLLLNEFFGNPDLLGTGTIITQGGYIFILSIGGITFMIIGLLGFLLIQEKTNLELTTKKSFIEEFKNIFNMEELTKNKEFYKFIGAFTVFNSGIYTILPYLFIYIFDLGFSTLSLVIIIGISAPILFIIIYILGKLSDRHGRKKFLPHIILISSIGFFIAPFLAALPEPILPLYILVFSLVFITILGIQTPLNALHQDLLPEDKRGKFLGILNIINTVSQILGTTVGGIVASFFGLVAIFAFAPIFFIISIPFFMKVKETLPEIKR